MSDRQMTDFEIKLYEENQKLKKALRYYTSPESLRFYTDVAVNTLKECGEPEFKEMEKLNDNKTNS